MAEERVTLNPCQGYGCHENCVLEVHSRGDKIIRVQRANIPSPSPGPQICSKGVLCKQIPFAEDRILYPLKRVGERGKGEFERISWDQAFQEIGDKINELAEQYGKRSILINCFWCGVPGADRSLNHDLANRFLNGYGGTRIEHPMVDFGSFISGAIDFGLVLNNGRFLLNDVQTMCIIWGCNPIGFTRPGPTTHMFMDARERGVKLVHISNLFDCTSAKVDQWMPINSGTDAALALAMAHIIVRDGLVDEEFMKQNTTGAYLVREDTGKYLRASEAFEGGSPDSFVFIDENDGQPYAIGRFTGLQLVNRAMMYSGADVDNIEARDAGEFGSHAPQLDASVEVNGIKCNSAYNLLVKHLEPWTAERQEELTGISAQACEDLAHEYIASAPACIFMYDGLRYRNSTQACRSIYLLSYLSGNFGKRGGSIIVGGTDYHDDARFDVRATYFPTPESARAANHISMRELLESIEGKTDQVYKAWINPFANPLLNWPNRDLWKKKVLPSLELFVSFEIHMSDTARYADYVLPEATSFERHEILGGPYNSATLCEPAIPPQGESKTCADIWAGIAAQVGIPQHFDMPLEDWVLWKIALGIPGDKEMLAPITEEEDPEHAGEVAPVTYQRLAKMKSLHLNWDDDSYDKFRNGAMHNITGRIEFYQEVLSDVGPMADFQEPMLFDDWKDEYPLQFYSARHKYFMQSQFTNIPELRKLAMTTQTGVALNPVTAKERGLRDGDLVDVFNQRGCIKKMKLHLREDIRPGMAHVWYSFDEKYYPDNDNPQVLENPINTNESMTDFSYTWGVEQKRRELASGAPISSLFILEPVTNEVFWDARCDVRKAGN